MKFQPPFPYRFNPWKHHRNWVRQHISLNSSPSEKDEIISIMRSINSNQVDMYTGELSPEEIIMSIDLELKQKQAYKKPDFIGWLNNAEFQLITLSDSSVWIVRLGLEDDRYIHFHPARNSSNAVRIHGNSWKTAVVIKLLYPDLTDLNLPLINEIRQSILELSPVKDLRGSSRLYKALELLEDN